MVQDNGSNESSISITLRDTRDNNTYTVAKLKDGKCWMTQDLKIYNAQLSPSDSDIENTFFLADSSFSNYGKDVSQSVYADVTGTYYSWATATAGEGASALNNGQKTSHSICPSAWTLPSRAEYTDLIASYNYNKGGELLKDPIKIIFPAKYIHPEAIYDAKDFALYYFNESCGGNACQLFIYSNTYTFSATNPIQGERVRCIKRV